MLANNNFRMMSLLARGLLYTLRLEYWVENPLPSDPVKLSKILRLEQELVSGALDELGGLIRCSNGMINIPELDDYRIHLAEIRRKQSVGGKEGAKIAHDKAANRKKSMRTADGDSQVNHEVSHASTQGYSVQNSPVKSNTEQPNSVISERDKWLAEYEKNDVAQATAALSRN
jgi:hypothetical protein